MSPVRPCVERLPDGRGCPRMAVPGGSRCQEHQSERDKNRNRSPSSRVTWRARWKSVRAAVISQRRQADGTWQCEVCHTPIINETLIEVDHIKPVSEGGAEYDESNLRLAHRRCNRRLGGLAAAAQRQRRTEATLYYQRRRKS